MALSNASHLGDFASNGSLLQLSMVNASHLNQSKSLCHPLSANSSSMYCPYTDAQFKESYMVLFCVYPILLAICTIGNVINLTILLKEIPKGPTNVYMTVVAVACLFVLWLWFPVYLSSLYVILDNKSTLLYNYKTYHEYEGIRMWGKDTALITADWVLIAFSMTRLMAVVQPFSFKAFQTAKAARIISFILLCLAALFMLVDVVEYYSRKYPYLGSVAKKNRPPWLKTWYETLQVPAEVANTLLKFVALIVINGTMLVVLNRQRNSDCNQHNSAQRANSDRRYRNSNILLPACVPFTVTQLPWLVMNILNTAADSFGSEAAKVPADVRKFAEPFFTLCQLTNYSVNFIMYVTFSKRFREQFMEIFIPKACRNRLGGCLKRKADGNSRLGQDVRLNTLKTSSTTITK
ncbi:hypothetical protein BV898_01236 [Hypsibius exemplaris]|uniref:G-protein coupled receptors family 1 profile domain-containing protein n=1 Tax=Hypsibius exemplaris TaxID=2072580 RepID=A0A1W0XC02_HYPEX|nr:hypothetical protein BV898_01236 [Hypsibius exemplaris]